MLSVMRGSCGWRVYRGGGWVDGVRELLGACEGVGSRALMLVVGELRRIPGSGFYFVK